MWRRGGRVIVACLATTGPATAQAAPAVWQDVGLWLRGALYHNQTANSRADLLLHLGYHDGEWRPYVIGWAGAHRDADGQLTLKEKQFNQMDHVGTATARAQDDGTVVLDIEMRINPDPWIAGGAATFRVRLKPIDGGFAGTFEGAFNDRLIREGEAEATLMPKPWPAPVAGVAPAAANEHPRLLFRKGDLPALRQRAQTPEGKAILDRLRATLGGGEAMPTAFSQAQHAYDGRGKRAGSDSYTLWHAMGFGFLYQLTEEKKYAELARQCVDKAREGVRDRDARYAFVDPGGKLRAGSSYAAIAMAYDLCYDAWPADYRQELAREIQDRVVTPGDTDPAVRALKEPVRVGLLFQTGGGQHSPWSNHYGAWNGGGGSAILAIMGDDGTDHEITQLACRVFLRRAKRALRVGFGDGGWFFEGHHGGRLSANTGLVTYLNQLRTSQGLDLVEGCPQAQWITSKWMFEIIRQDGKLLSPQQGIYASRTFERGGMSTGADFARGFGIVPEDHRPALKWFFNHVVEPGERKTYDAIQYPHHAVFAFLYWPIDEPEQNPAQVVGKVLRDHQAQYIVLRTGWSGTDDDAIAALRRGGGDVIGMGLKAGIRAAGGAERKFEKLGTDTYVMHYESSALVADLHGPAGSPMTLISIHGLDARADNPAQADERELTENEKQLLRSIEEQAQRRGERSTPEADRDRTIKEQGDVVLLERSRNLAGHRVTVHTLTRGEAPPIVIDGTDDQQTLTIGGLSVRVEQGEVRVSLAPADADR